MSYAGTLHKLRQIANDGDVSVSQKYANEAEKFIYPKKKTDPNGLHEAIINQIESEYQEAYSAFKVKIGKYLTRLKLYNNQMRADNAVGDPHIFVNHQTVLAALYTDHLQTEFQPREEGDIEVANNLNILWEFDYDQMFKAWHDYQYDWDAGFYGWGLKWIYEFDRKSKTPVQQIWDPASFIRDPRAKTTNHESPMRFGGREVYLTKTELDKNPEYFNLDKLKGDGGNGGNNSIAFLADQQRRQAQGITSNVEQISGVNSQYSVLQWLTHLKIGDKIKKCIIELANDRNLVIRITPLETEEWPLIKRDLYPMSHSWDGVSTPDLTEDKQRFRAMLLNVMGQAARADVEPMYLFDKSKITNQTDFKFGFNKFIPINGPVGESVLMPMRKAQPGSQAAFILDFLDMSSSKALATPQMLQGVQNNASRTLGENQLVIGGANVRRGLTAKLWGLSEKEECRFWYENYERNFEEGIDKKQLRLAGTYNSWTFKPLKREDIVANSPLGLDIKIESKEVSAAQKLELFNKMTPYLSSVLQDPTADRAYGLRLWGKQFLTREQVENILPLSIDERLARKENEKLNKGEPVKVNLEDNHAIHRRVHESAQDNPATRAHREAHDEAEIYKRVIPQAFPALPGEQQLNQQGNTADTMSSAMPAAMNNLNKGQPSQNPQASPMMK